MSKKIYLISLIIIVTFISISSILRSTGSPGAKTNSPLDGSNCTECHSGTTTTVNDWISTNIPGTGYVPGQTYEITATGTHTGVGKFGFELTAEDASSKVGTFIITNSTKTKLVNNNSSVTHTSDGNDPSGDQKSWSVNWTAPSAGTGDVTFYAAFNAANGNGSDTGDKIYLTSAIVSEDQGSSVNSAKNLTIELYPNPANDFLIINSDFVINDLHILSHTGKLVYHRFYGDTKSVFLNILNLKSGMYFIQVKNNEKRITKKVFIQ